MRGAETAEAALAVLRQPRGGLRHESVGSALAVFLGKIAADQDHLAGECLGDGGGLLIEATQDIDEAVGRHRFERRRRGKQHRVGHGWPLRPCQQGGGECRKELAVQSAQMRAYPTLDAVTVGVQFGKGDGCGLIIAGIAVEFVNRRLDRRRNRLSGRAG